MQQVTLNIIFDGNNIRLNASGIGPEKPTNKMRILNAGFFSTPSIKFGTRPENEFDIFFLNDKHCSGEGKNNPLITGTSICQHCYSEQLGEKMQEVRKSKRKNFIDYQVEQQSDKLQWLNELHSFVIDNEDYLNERDFSVSYEFKNLIEEKQQELNPEIKSPSDNLSFLTSLLKIASPDQKAVPKLKWNRNDVDLLEFVTALHRSGAINNEAGNLTRAGAIEFFENLFGIEIKDAESKLSKATDRKRSRHPFLDELVKQFAAYCEDKDSLKSSSR
jgi:hypothetical protein